MKTPRKHAEPHRIRAALSTHETAKKLIGILNGDEHGLRDEIMQEYASGTVDFTELAEKFSGRLGTILGENTITLNSYRSILHRVLAGYRGGKIGEEFSGLFASEEYAGIIKKRHLETARLCHLRRSELEARINWTPEMESVLIQIDSLTLPYQPGKHIIMAQIMETIYQKKFSPEAIRHRISKIKKREENPVTQD